MIYILMPLLGQFLITSAMDQFNRPGVAAELQADLEMVVRSVGNYYQDESAQFRRARQADIRLYWTSCIQEAIANGRYNADEIKARMAIALKVFGNCEQDKTLRNN